MNNNNKMMVVFQKTRKAAAKWTIAENRIFEDSLVTVPEDLPNRWEKIAEKIPDKTAADVEYHYEILLLDIRDIEAGRIKIPNYADMTLGSDKAKQAETERKKGTPWSEEEHRLFLVGLHKYGKGDWRSISRNVVISRTPTQVASHAQKYFLRLNSARRERKRSSIHDITTADSESVNMPVDQNRTPPSEGAVQQLTSPAGGSVQSSASPPAQQPVTMQQMPPSQQYPNQGVPMGYQNYGFQL